MQEGELEGAVGRGGVCTVKLGVRAWGDDGRVGEEGRGVPAIIEMVTLTRLDCVLGSAGGMRLALAEAQQALRQNKNP